MAGFDCGTPALNTWLQTMARQQMKKGAAKTFVVIDDEAPKVIQGFYALAVRPMMAKDDLPVQWARRLPREVSGFTLARLAVNKDSQGQGVGGFLLIDALERIRAVAAQVGGSVLFVDAKDGQAAFYEHFGFVAMPSDPLKLALPLAELPV